MALGLHQTRSGRIHFLLACGLAMNQKLWRRPKHTHTHNVLPHIKRCAENTCAGGRRQKASKHHPRPALKRAWSRECDPHRPQRARPRAPCRRTRCCRRRQSQEEPQEILQILRQRSPVPPSGPASLEGEAPMRGSGQAFAKSGAWARRQCCARLRGRWTWNAKADSARPAIFRAGARSTPRGFRGHRGRATETSSQRLPMGVRGCIKPRTLDNQATQVL